MTEQERKKVGVAAFEAVSHGLATGDLQAFGDYLSDDVELTMLGTSPIAGTHVGKKSVLRWFSNVHRGFPKGLELKARNVMVGDSVVAVEFDNQGIFVNGRPYENHGVIVFEIRDGKIAAWREYLDTERIKALSQK